jgi:hypothetical protein
MFCEHVFAFILNKNNIQKNESSKGTRPNADEQDVSNQQGLRCNTLQAPQWLQRGALLCVILFF